MNAVVMLLEKLADETGYFASLVLLADWSGEMIRNGIIWTMKGTLRTCVSF